MVKVLDGVIFIPLLRVGVDTTSAITDAMGKT